MVPKPKHSKRNPSMSLTDLFCDVDRFCKIFLPIWEQKQLEDGPRKRLRKIQLSISEIMMIVILFHQSNYRTLNHSGSWMAILHQTSPCSTDSTISASRDCSKITSHDFLWNAALQLQKVAGICDGPSFNDSLTHGQ